MKKIHFGIIIILIIGIIVYIMNTNSTKEVVKIKLNEETVVEISAYSFVNLQPSYPEPVDGPKAYFSFELSGIDKKTFFNNYEIESIMLNGIIIDNADILYEEDDSFRFYSNKYNYKNNRINIIITDKNGTEKCSIKLRVPTGAAF